MAFLEILTLVYPKLSTYYENLFQYVLKGRNGMCFQVTEVYNIERSDYW